MDAHCHLQDNKIFADHKNLIENANAIGIKYMVCCATHEKDFNKVKKLSVQYNSIIPSYGIHPWFVENLSCEWEKNLIGVLESEKTKSNKRYTPGIGETGLDFAINNYNSALQEKIFTDQLIIAKEMNIPISIHIRKAWDVFIHIIKKTGHLRAGGLIHSYSGSPDMIPLFEKYGLYISFSGSITRPGTKKVIKALEIVSDDKMLIETDSPYIMPSILSKNKNNNINKPENLVLIADIASQIRKIPVKEYGTKTFNNGVRLFKIPEN